MSELKILLNEKSGNDKAFKIINSFTPARILAIGFALLILLGGLILSLPIATEDGMGTPLIDSLFTATSAVCVTGLVVVDTADHFSVLGEIVILCLIQIGGLGFMTFATLFAILLGRKINLRQRILLQESFNQLSLEGIVRLVKNVLIFSFTIEGIGALILFLRWYGTMGLRKALYYAVFHAVSAFNNAGFDLFGNFSSLTGQTNDIVLNFTVMTLIILGGLGFAVLVDIYNKGDKKLSLHSRLVLKTTFWLILIGFVFIFLSEFNNPKTLANMDLLTKIQASLFHSVTPRTAGFNTIPMPDLKLSTIFFTILLMFIGASPGSTGGGIKTTTFLSLVLCTISVLKGQDQIVVKERTLPNSIIRKSFVITFLAFFWISTVVLILLLTEKVDFLPVVFETVSAFGTVGLSLGITPSLTFIGKVLIIFTMFFGRVGLLTVMLAIALRNNRTVALSHIKYPEEKIIIG